MKSLILQISTRYLKILILAFSVYLLVRGHNAPGGGFVGGLMAATAFVLHAIAFDVNNAREAVRFDTKVFIGLGLLSSITSGFIALFLTDPFFKGEWTEVHLPAHLTIALGTPVLFDIGVYLVVFGVTLTIIFGLMEEG